MFWNLPFSWKLALHVLCPRWSKKKKGLSLSLSVSLLPIRKGAGGCKESPHSMASYPETPISLS